MTCRRVPPPQRGGKSVVDHACFDAALSEFRASRKPKPTDADAATGSDAFAALWQQLAAVPRAATNGASSIEDNE